MLKTEWNRQTKNMFISSSSAKFEEKLFVYNVVVVVVWDYSWPFQQISHAGKILHAGNFRAGKVLLEMLEKWNFF